MLWDIQGRGLGDQAGQSAKKKVHELSSEKSEAGRASTHAGESDFFVAIHAFKQRVEKVATWVSQSWL